MASIEAADAMSILLGQAREAQMYLESESQFGKIVFKVMKLPRYVLGQS